MMKMPDDVPVAFEEPLDDYRNGTIDAPELRKRMADAILREPSLEAFKDQYLDWVDHDDTVTLGIGNNATAQVNHG